MFGLNPNQSTSWVEKNLVSLLLDLTVRSIVPMSVFAIRPSSSTGRATDS